MPIPLGLTPLTPSPALKQSLNRLILRQRERQKQEAEQSAALQMERKAREEKMRRDNATLEQTKEQINHLRKRMAELQQDRHELFSQLKKVLNQEDEQKKRIEKQQEQFARDSMEILNKVGPCPAPALSFGAGTGPPPPPPKPGGQPVRIGRSPPHATPTIPAKRPRSPSPKPSPYYGSPKIASPYQRSPYPQQFGPPPAKVSAGAFSHLSAAGLANLPPPPPPPRMQGGLPVLPPHKQVGGITSGFPVQKSVAPTLLQTQQPKSLFPPGSASPYTQQRYF